MGGGKGVTESEKEDSTAPPPPPPPPAEVKKKRRGIISCIWNGIFRLKRDDLAKRLEYISKEEASVIARMKRRSQTWRWLARQLIIFTVIFEVIAVGYAIMTTRSVDLNWKMRAFQVLPIFLLPGLSWLAYSGFASFTRMCDRKDQKTLERLRAERQAKIDELKEKTNYYTTQQLIQRYDPDPAAKAAAATVLASKLGLDSGLKVYLGDESKLSIPTAKSSDVEIVQSSGLRNRKKLNTTRASSVESTPNSRSGETTPESSGNEGLQMSEHNQLVVNHYPQGSSALDRGWIAQIAALLVGEDPAQSYALICGNCHMHNGLARKEDFPHITYYCPHCHALNRPKQSEERERVSGSLSNSHETSSLTSGGNGDPVNNASSDLINDTSSPKSDSSHPSNSPVKEKDSSAEEVGKVTSLDSAVN